MFLFFCFFVNSIRIANILCSKPVTNSHDVSGLPSLALLTCHVPVVEVGDDSDIQFVVKKEQKGKRGKKEIRKRKGREK